MTTETLLLPQFTEGTRKRIEQRIKEDLAARLRFHPAPTKVVRVLRMGKLTPVRANRYQRRHILVKVGAK